MNRQEGDQKRLLSGPATFLPSEAAAAAQVKDLTTGRARHASRAGGCVSIPRPRAHRSGASLLPYPLLLQPRSRPVAYNPR